MVAKSSSLLPRGEATPSRLFFSESVLNSTRMQRASRGLSAIRSLARVFAVRCLLSLHGQPISETVFAAMLRSACYPHPARLSEIVAHGTPYLRLPISAVSNGTHMNRVRKRGVPARFPVRDHLAKLSDDQETRFETYMALQCTGNIQVTRPLQQACSKERCPSGKVSERTLRATCEAASCSRLGPKVKLL